MRGVVGRTRERVCQGRPEVVVERVRTQSYLYWGPPLFRIQRFPQSNLSVAAELIQRFDVVVRSSVAFNELTCSLRAS